MFWYLNYNQYGELDVIFQFGELTVISKNLLLKTKKWTYLWCQFEYLQPIITIAINLENGL
jgi:hypothetical protein